MTFKYVSTVLCATVLLVIMPSCSRGDIEVSYEIEGDWVVQFYVEDGTPLTKDDLPTWENENGGDITVSFSALDESGRGTVSGTSVTNSFGGSYTMPEEGIIAIPVLAGTLVAEPPWTGPFNLSAVDRFEILGTQLRLYDDDNSLTIVLERQ